MANKPKKKPKRKPPIKPRPFKEFVSYRQLAKGFQNWGIEFSDKIEAKKMKNSPCDQQLTFGLLISIADSLKEIRDELKRERTIK